ncbi:MAG: AAA family ATPase [Phycisphaerales bacterium]|nr:AAA family ATPase [Phycisphaerales bacterium]
MARKPAGTSKADAPTKPVKGARAKPVRGGGRALQPREVTIQAPPGLKTQDFLPLGSLLGQQRALDLIRAALESGRLPHAILFCGPVGVGKFSAAWALATALLDPEARRAMTEPGGTAWLLRERDTPVVRLAKARAHPDLHVIRKELAAFCSDEKVRTSKQTNIPVGVVREFCIEPAARSRQVEGDSLAAKVLIIDEAHLLADAGQNALLKTLEEPPEGTVIILVTASEERLYPTIRSRCRRVPFAPLGEADMRELLQRRSISAEPWLLTVAEGSPGVALWAVEEQIGPWFDRFSESLDVLARGGYRHDLSLAMVALAEQCKAKVTDADDQASRETAGHHACAQVLGVIGSILRDRLNRAGKAADGAPSFWASCIEHAVRAEGYIARNVAPQFVFENFVASMRESAHQDRSM